MQQEFIKHRLNRSVKRVSMSLMTLRPGEITHKYTHTGLIPVFYPQTFLPLHQEQVNKI